MIFLLKISYLISCQIFNPQMDDLKGCNYTAESTKFQMNRQEIKNQDFEINYLSPSKNCLVSVAFGTGH